MRVGDREAEGGREGGDEGLRRSSSSRDRTHSYEPPSNSLPLSIPAPPSLSLRSFPFAKIPELNVWSDCITFTAPPFFPSKEVEGGAGGGGKDVTYTFAVFGDMGTAEEDGSTNMGGEEVGR